MIRNGFWEKHHEGRITDEASSLSPDAVRQLLQRREMQVYPRVSRVYTGPVKRCRETAALIYKGFPALILRELSGFHFGAFEGVRRDEMLRDPRFHEWESSDHVPALPGGVSPYLTNARNMREFRSVIDDMEENGIHSAAVITNGSVIVMILNRYAEPLLRYCELEISHGGGCTFVYDTGRKSLRIKNTF